LVTAGHIVIALQILDPDEIEFPWTDAASLRFEDIRDERAAVEGSGLAQREAYLAAATAHLDRLSTRCEAGGVRLVRHRTDAPLRSAGMRVLRSVADPAAAGAATRHSGAEVG
jgi:hypothetical protein